MTHNYNHSNDVADLEHKPQYTCLQIYCGLCIYICLQIYCGLCSKSPTSLLYLQANILWPPAQHALCDIAIFFSNPMTSEMSSISTVVQLCATDIWEQKFVCSLYESFVQGLTIDSIFFVSKLLHTKHLLNALNVNVNMLMKVLRTSSFRVVRATWHRQVYIHQLFDSILFDSIYLSQFSLEVCHDSYTWPMCCEMEVMTILTYGIAVNNFKWETWSS